mgnify:FL=1
MRHLQRYPIWRDANRLLVEIERAVRGFPRYHKYPLGSELRRQAMTICRLISRAISDKQRQYHHLERLKLAVDDLKTQIQLAKELQVFSSFTQFQTLSELAVAVGRQSGGWAKRLISNNPKSPSVTEGGVC